MVVVVVVVVIVVIDVVVIGSVVSSSVVVIWVVGDVTDSTAVVAVGDVVVVPNVIAVVHFRTVSLKLKTTPLLGICQLQLTSQMRFDQRDAVTCVISEEDEETEDKAEEGDMEELKFE